MCLHESEALLTRKIGHLLLSLVEYNKQNLVLAHLTELHGPLDEVFLLPAEDNLSFVGILYGLGTIVSEFGHI